jgi:hypothetical protein
MVSVLGRGFWNLPHSSKLDELTEKRHQHVILEALRDEETKIVKVDRNAYTLYGDKEALLVRPQSLVMRLTMILYSAVQQDLCLCLSC